jgi:hypothetical protein
MSETTKQKIVRRLREGDGAGVRVRRGARNLGAQLSGLSALAEGLALVAEVQHGLVVGHLGEIPAGESADREERREWMWSQVVDELEEISRTIKTISKALSVVDRVFD